MSNYIKEFPDNILALNLYIKRAIVITTDVGLCILCTWLAFVLRLEELIIFKDLNFYPALISVVIAIPVFWLFGLYKVVFRYTGLSIIISILASSFLYGLLYFLVIGVYGISSYAPHYANVPRSIGILQPILLFLAIINTRLLIKYIIKHNQKLKKTLSKKNILIYGAGEAGSQLFISLENNLEFKVIGFLDDDEKLAGRVLLGQNIYSTSSIEKLLSNKNVDYVFLALPAISRNKRNKIIENLNKFKLKVKTLPSISQIVDGRIRISDIKDLSIDDLLNREQVEPDIKLLKRNVYSQNVLITGAGGSIGSELSRQILKLNPNKLILLELNEYALYKIYEELISYNKDFKIIPLLANAQDQFKLERIFETFKVDTIYHSAAYKHVPLVEENICEGIKNNVNSTLAVTKASINKNVLNLVLISSDKAVRPTNIMGASKRLSELCLQGIYNKTKTTKTNFSIVRFGNVLESSGSVIPKFKKQINEGGPITLTHKDVTRYFMTVTEAAQLVIQAGAMGKNSEVFVLDMGESVKIKNLIQRMITLSGFNIKNSKNPNGDIEIKITGLRPGEKLYEELLIGNNPQKTSHPKIKKTSDPFVPFEQLEKELNILNKLLTENNVKEVKIILEKLNLYKSNSKIVDHIYIEKSFTE